MEFLNGAYEFFSTSVEIFIKYSNFFIEGMQSTLILALFSVIVGSFFGIFLAFSRMSKFKLLRYPATAYIEFIRGTPLLIQLTFLFYGLPMIGIEFPDIAFIPNFQRMTAGIVAISFNSCAYVAEIIRAGIQAVDKGQDEAARAMGFNKSQTMRLVVLPQAIKNILPALGNEFVTIIKETSVVSVIGIADLTFRTSDVRSITYIQLEPLFIAAILYFIMTFSIGRLVSYFERKMKNDG